MVGFFVLTVVVLCGRGVLFDFVFFVEVSRCLIFLCEQNRLLTELNAQSPGQSEAGAFQNDENAGESDGCFKRIGTLVKERLGRFKMMRMLVKARLGC